MVITIGSDPIDKVSITLPPVWEYSLTGKTAVSKTVPKGNEGSNPSTPVLP